jgi:putative addiction module killer protein
LTKCIQTNTIESVYEIRQTDVFDRWLSRLKDVKGKAKIIARLDSLRLGNLGDTKFLGDSLRELRIHSGPGYRLYFFRRGEAVIVLLCGGYKSTQSRDISRARKILSTLTEGED